MYEETISISKGWTGRLTPKTLTLLGHQRPVVLDVYVRKHSMHVRAYRIPYRRRTKDAHYRDTG
jgi:hypothetical protein